MDEEEVEEVDEVEVEEDDVGLGDRSGNVYVVGLWWYDE